MNSLQSHSLAGRALIVLLLPAAYQPAALPPYKRHIPPRHIYSCRFCTLPLQAGSSSELCWAGSAFPYAGSLLPQAAVPKAAPGFAAGIRNLLGLFVDTASTLDLRAFTSLHTLQLIAREARPSLLLPSAVQRVLVISLKDSFYAGCLAGVARLKVGRCAQG